MVYNERTTNGLQWNNHQWFTLEQPPIAINKIATNSH